MATLDKWRSFTNTPTTVVFPQLKLIGRDFAPPIASGAGEVRMRVPGVIEFTLDGTPTNVGYALAEIQRLRENPYDGLARWRLEGIDSDGNEWNGGYTAPELDIDSQP
jgi:hypothetical protein